jgi:hypothetical protein
MNTEQLNLLMRSDFHASKIFIGVFAADELPYRVQYPTCLIVNSDVSLKSGTHWFAIFIDSYGRGEYFDSFGLKPWVSHHINFLNKNCKSWNFNSETLQHMYSTLCGQYCAVYLCLKSRGASLFEITSHMKGENSLITDQKLLYLFNWMFKNKKYSEKKNHKKCQSCCAQRHF